MFDFLYQIDVNIFYTINNGLSNKLFDRFFSLITDVNHWYIAYALLLGFLLIKGGKKGRIAAIGVLLLIIVTDQLSHSIIKEIIQRIRPCNALPGVKTPLGTQGTYSFPSNHAVNNFAMAVFFSRIYPDYKVLLFIIASLIAFSRIYVGLHYPSDVVGGAIIGSAIGYIFSIAALKLIGSKAKKGK